MSHEYDNGAPPPTYEAAVSESLSMAPSKPPPPPLRPPYNPPSNIAPPLRRPPPQSRPSVPTPSEPDIYTNSDELPWKYPPGHFCRKCKNTGFKPKNGRLCSDCWKKFLTRRIAYNPNPELPFKFPPGFICDKCHNSGYRKGKTCKHCWSDFGPRNSSSSVTRPPPSVAAMGMLSSSGFINGGLRVLPGDPRIGGILCGRCRGSGVTHFFLDTDPCDMCQGLGRIITAPPGPAPIPYGPGPSYGNPPGPPHMPYGPGPTYGTPPGPQPGPYGPGPSYGNHPEPKSGPYGPRY